MLDGGKTCEVEGKENGLFSGFLLQGGDSALGLVLTACSKIDLRVVRKKSLNSFVAYTGVPSC